LKNGHITHYLNSTKPNKTTIQTIMNSIYENNRFQNILKARRKLFFYLVYQIGYPIYYFQIY